MMYAAISNYFEGLREDFEGAYYGMYFLEVADYYTRENNDEREMLKLVYQSLRAVLADIFPFSFVRITTLLSYSPTGSAFKTIPVICVYSLKNFGYNPKEPE